jgi:hypothetical protein
MTSATSSTASSARPARGKYEVNLPLTELEIPDDSPNFQFIEDYWYWFWNWRLKGTVL